jgi:uncharacterized peroxidase-related enzyme
MTITESPTVREAPSAPEPVTQASLDALFQQDQYLLSPAFISIFLSGEERADVHLSRREREIIWLVVAADIGCIYCHTNHAQILGSVIDDHALGQRIAINHRVVEELTDREHALAEVASTFNHDARDITDAHYAELRSHGLTDEEILETFVVAALAGGIRFGVVQAAQANPDQVGRVI